MANLGYMQVTRRCNQKCRFCSNPEREADMPLKKGLAYIDDLKEKRFLCVLFTGGEPTLSENLPRFLAHCRETDFMSKLCTNGQKLADPDYLKSLIDNGLTHVCVSLHSHLPEVQAALTQNPDSAANIFKALDNLSRHPDVTLDILTTINKYNSGHLSETTKFLLGRFPSFSHVTWNNLDPRMNRTAENPDTIPRLSDFHLELALAMDLLAANGKPFQVERVPLCYMAEHASRSTETRRIVKREERLTYFLDERGCLRWKDWEHDKADCCAICSLNEICAGLYQMNAYYFSNELFPVFVRKEPIIDKIINE
ncbi:MAG: radical SAM protein [bacterium]